MLPHRALIRAHQGLAQFVLAARGGQAVQQQQQHGPEEHGRLGGGVWSGVLRGVRGPRGSGERSGAWSGDYEETVDSLATIPLRCELERCGRFEATRLQPDKSPE